MLWFDKTKYTAIYKTALLRQASRVSDENVNIKYYT